ncbi:uncharacterized protein M421DRAFT_417164 [Didymella exigua CBS 183.55]|uniref:Uncharacterized protein n=1 Tax=Didymella exigua CBS 183.55 TaxID=1150837 RepID=A0A6A5RYL6_9PLEO|nr:uncharacterized protein M421DRAFT_417164 [Didymella exigua CBS 183.55]KAF1932450.1 hypothetical protein M421DRAFT_417164 [Didymella exigua CBS 183.55]
MWHNCYTRSNAEEVRQQQLLSPQQEEVLVKYIERCTRDSLPPTRSMLQNVASVVTKWETTRIDRERFLANSKRKYKLYFNLLHSKMREHSVDERNTYNIDKKGFFVSINSYTKRIVSKAI